LSRDLASTVGEAFCIYVETAGLISGPSRRVAGRVGVSSNVVVPSYLGVQEVVTAREDGSEVGGGRGGGR
jgi:hypothetical protein